MKIAFFDTHHFDKNAFEFENQKYHFEIKYFDEKLNSDTAFLANGFPVVCAFVNDKINRATLKILKNNGCELISLRCAGVNQVDLKAAAELGIKVVRVPEYSPYAVAEHTVALIQGLNRKIHRAYNRVREGNFSLNGLVGFDLHNKTFGILGVGKIGKVLAKIMSGFGCRVLLYDKILDHSLETSLNCTYTNLDEIFSQSDIISLNLPLVPETRHCINESCISKMKKGVMIINTGRGALIDTAALINGLKSGQIGAAGLDVYEEEEGLFFQDHSGEVLNDDVLARLLTFPNVIITGHQAFLTKEALQNIAETSLANIFLHLQGKPLLHVVG